MVRDLKKAGIRKVVMMTGDSTEKHPYICNLCNPVSAADRRTDCAV